MATIMSTGQITLVDLTDERVSSFYLQANQSKIQVYDVNEKTYSPDYSISPNLVITPYFFFGNEDYTNKLNSSNLTYTINGVAVPTTGAVQNGNILTISKNMVSGDAPFNTETLKIIATIKENSVTDETTGITISNTTTADIEFVKVNTGTNGVSIEDVNQLYQLSTSSSTAPSKPTSPSDLKGWSYNNPSWDSTKVQYLWICTETIYSNNTYSYTTPYTDENWKTAADAVASMEGSFGELKELVDTLQDEVDNAIETWYIEGEPSIINPPWGDEDSSTHVGDLYYNTETGYSYRFFKKDDGTYEWTRISDSDITKALEDVANLQTVVDGKVTIYYNEESTPPDTTKLNKDDLWIKPDGNFYKWDGDSWEIANTLIDRIEVQYNKNQSNTIAPEETDDNWSTTTPDWEEGYYIWQRTATYYKESDKPVLSPATCISVAGAAGADGADAVFAIVESNSKIIFTDNDDEDITLVAALYVGGAVQESTEENPITYSWSAIDDDTPNSINDTKTNQLIVARSDVLNIRTFICTITYKGNNYTDRITISDKTDPIYCVLESSAGDKFTNGVINTTLKCRVFKGEGEVDTKEPYQYTYSWQKFDKNSTTPNTTFGTKTGKTITIGSNDVEAKAVFTCTVTKASSSS